MASQLIKKIKVGNIEVIQWQGEYEGKPTTSFSLKKIKKNKDGKFEETPFYGITDIQSAMVACMGMLQAYYNVQDNQKEPAF